MGQRKGELSKGAIDGGWPHQVALPADQCMGAHHNLHRDFCASAAPSLCPRGHTFLRDDVYFNVFCFTEREHAERFHAQFGGEMIKPKDRPRWPGRR
jgi:hypothetical protein